MFEKFSKYKPSLPFKETAKLLCKGAVIAAPFLALNSIVNHYGGPHIGTAAFAADLALGTWYLKRSFEERMKELFGRNAITKSTVITPPHVAFLSSLIGYGIDATIQDAGNALIQLATSGHIQGGLFDIKNSRLIFAVIAPILYSGVKSIIGQNDPAYLPQPQESVVHHNQQMKIVRLFARACWNVSLATKSKDQQDAYLNENFPKLPGPQGQYSEFGLWVIGKKFAQAKAVRNKNWRCSQKPAAPGQS